jgi:hypothetical protein
VRFEDLQSVAHDRRSLKKEGETMKVRRFTRRLAEVARELLAAEAAVSSLNAMTA